MDRVELTLVGAAAPGAYDAAGAGTAARAATAETLDAVVALQARVGDLFLRISAGPEVDGGQPPVDEESRYPLPGIPVHPLRPEAWWTGDARLWVARQLVYRGERFAGRRRVHPWLVTGTVVGRSAWGEPLLAQWSPVATVGPRVLTQAGLVYAGWRSREADGPAVRRRSRLHG